MVPISCISKSLLNQRKTYQLKRVPFDIFISINAIKHAIAEEHNIVFISTKQINPIQ